MKRRIADVYFQILAQHGVEHTFFLSGGGIMYFTDALGRSSIQHVCCHHEQAAGIAAQAYAQQRNSLGVCLVTTGPGGTNALTACAAAYVDSTPVLFLSGQVKRADFASLRKVRQFGAQENDIISMARPVTKYAVLVDDAKTAVYHLEKALWIALQGRQGPVWVDVPLDIQCAEIEEEEILRFDPTTESLTEEPTVTASSLNIAEGVAHTVALLAKAKRPLFLMGHGLVASGAADAFYNLAQRLQVPVEATWRALGIFDYTDPLFFGSPGLQAVRSDNIILQSADLVIVLGSRLDNMITAFAESRFAVRAHKVIVDIDPAELAKYTMPHLTPVLGNVAEFVQELDKQLPKTPLALEAWKTYCTNIKQRFPLLKEKQAQDSPLTNLYHATAAIAQQCTAQDVLVVSSTSRCNTAGHMAFQHKKGQHPISSMGMGSMGFALPSAVGAAFATNKQQRVLVLEGDGSLQLNIQELQTIMHYNLDVKLFIFSNGGYAAIATMQDRNFAGFHVGSDPQSGVDMPSLEKIAAAYGLHFVRIANNAEIEDGVQKTLSLTGPVLCEVVGDITFDEIPKCISSVTPEGVRVSAALENPFPFLSDEEMTALFNQLPE